MNCHTQLTVILFFLITSALTSPLRAQQVDTLGVIDNPPLLDPSPLDLASFVQFPEKGCQYSTYFVGEVSNLRGWVEYRSDLKSHVIVYAVPNTLDIQYTYIICHWPTITQHLGKSVTVSGKRYQARGVLPKYGGETILYLHLTAVRPN
jgi:hypothetical protein